jgi:tRNA threonylcarbamoyladenosine biosynthesis protein TsaE
MTSIAIPSIDHIDIAAEELVRHFGQHTKVAFSGEMGAGKTTLIQAVCRVLNVQDVVASPTFALINEYYTEKGDSIFHFDLYRIEDVSEMYDFGYEDYFYSDKYCFIEWPEKAMELMPPDTLFLNLRVNKDVSREVLFESTA